MSRRLLVRAGLRLVAAAAAVALTAVLTHEPASGAFDAATGSAANSVATAASFCTAPGVQTVVVANDAWVDQGAAGTANGTTPALRVQSGVGANRRAYLRFTLPAVPVHCSLQSAELRLYNNSPTPGRTIDAYRADPAQSPLWGAGSLTWSNQPAYVGAPAASVAPAVAGLQTWDVTAHTVALLTGPNNGLVLLDRSESQNGPHPQAYDEQSTAGGTAAALRLTWG